MKRNSYLLYVVVIFFLFIILLSKNSFSQNKKLITKTLNENVIYGNVSGVILAHNHPSGSLKPSEPDVRITKKLQEGAKLLDLSMPDHLILSTEDYYSLDGNADLGTSD